MADLTITTDRALGPLTVEVLGLRGERVGSRLTLSSLRRETVVRAIPPGDYTVVGTRPSGERLVSSVRVGREGGKAVIAMAGRAPEDLLSDAAQLGLTYESSESIGSDFRLTALVSPQAANTASRSVGALLSRELLSEKGAALLSFDTGSTRSTTRSTSFTLAGWQYRDGTWQPVPCKPPKPDGDYLHVQLPHWRWHPGENRFRFAPIALGLFGEDGFGPIVIVPPFRESIDITFLAAGVAMANSAERVGNPSAVRVPVALAVPWGPGLADLLLGLNAGILPNATEILEAGREPDAAAALDHLAHKFEDPAAAILGAVFLARFAPLRLPLPWLRNLNAILPDIADSWLLLAWARSVQGDGEIDWDMTITEQLRRAATCRCTYLSRSRAQLGKLMLQHGPFPRARQDFVSTPRRSRTGDYLNFGADAGGLEAFWGHSPRRPGRDTTYPWSKPTGPIVQMRQGRFVDRATPG